VVGVSREAAFFDLDKTLIATSSTLSMARPLQKAGLLTRRAMVRSLRDQLTYITGAADEVALQRMATHLGPMVQGWPVATIDRVVRESYDEVILPVIHHDVVRILLAHKQSGRDVIVISTSGQEIITPIALALGAHEAIGSRLEVVDGRWSGRVDRYVYGPEKAAIVRELAAERGYDLSACYAYSDSSTDVPLLSAVGHPFAVNPDKRLRVIAAERGWPVIDPEPLARRRARVARILPSVPTIPKAAIAIPAVVIPALLAARRRH
jgi:HAD superfamily hydrolase (TIGR01490 family)